MSRGTESQIRKRIESSGQPNHIDRLCLDSIPIESISHSVKHIIQSCTRLEYLTMNDCALGSLENFPILPHLITLQLNNNKLTGSDIKNITSCQEITFLSLANNNISSFDCLQNLKSLQLEILQIHDNEVSNTVNYREIIFQFMPNLKSIDCIDRQGNQIQEEEDDYITQKEPSGTDFAVFLEEEEQIQDEGEIRNTECINRIKINENSDNLEDNQNIHTGGQTSVNNPKRQHSSNSQHLPRNSTILNSDSQQQMDGEMIRDFKKKIQKKE